ncbi:MAG: transporter [Clostridia bacterium]|jgi:DHA3 family macrolide efflux protein-like MFS transporter|nr:transporter [Clostridia bacterium]
MNQNWKKNIILFLASQTISLFGSSLVQYAIMWYITLKTQSGLMMTISIICGFLPTFFISPFAGVWADRYNRKILIVLSDSMIAISTLIMAILFFMGYDALWLLFVISAVRSLGSGVQTPAIGAILPQLVPEDKLTKVNAINGSIQSLVMLASPMLSGALLTMTKIEIIFFIDVVTAIIGVLTMITLVKVVTHAKANEKREISYLSDFKNGIKYIKSHAYVKRFFLFCALFFFLATPVAFLTPLQVTRSFGNDVWRLTLIEITFSIGMMIGGILMSSWGGFKNKVHTMVLSGIAMGVCTFALGIVPVFTLYVIFMAIFGIFMPMFNTPSTVLLQEKVEEDYLGRVFGVYGMIASAIMPIGMIIFGPLSDMFKIEWLLLGTGVLILVISLFLLKNDVLIEAGKPKEEVS